MILFFTEFLDFYKYFFERLNAPTALGHMLMPSAQRWADNKCCRCITSCPDYKTPIRHQLAAIALISSAYTWEYVV